MTDWESFAVMAGGASSALTGLLFMPDVPHLQRVTGRSSSGHPWRYRSQYHHATHRQALPL